MKINRAFDNFIISKRAKGLTDKSIKNYQELLAPFVSFCGDYNVEKMPFSQVESYIIQLYDRKLSRASISTHITHIKAFIHWCNDNYSMQFTYKKIEVPKVNKKDVRIYSPDEIKLIFAKVSGSEEWIQKRNCCIIAFMYDSGLRQAEVCGVQKSDIDFYNKTIKVLGKGNKERKVPLGRSTERLLKAYLDVCPFDKEYVFVGRRGEAMTANAIKKFVQKMKSELPFEFGSHRLRHNFATNYCIDQYEEKGVMDAFRLMALLGHADLATSQRYIHAASEVIACKNNISHLDKIDFA